MTLVVPCTAESLKKSPLNQNNAHVFVKFFDEDKHHKMLYLSDFMDLSSKDILTLTNTKQVQMTAEKKVHSASTIALDKYSMLYVIQSKSDRAKGIYKVGVSTGANRLMEYFKMHGDKKGKCSGVYLIYLAGVERDKTKVRSQWNYRKERQIKDTLKRLKMPSVRGSEWIGVTKENLNAFKEIVTRPMGEITNKRRAALVTAIKDDGLFKKDEAVLKVSKPIKGQYDDNKGDYYYKITWRNPQIATHGKGNNLHKLTMPGPLKRDYHTYQSLEEMMAIKPAMNKARRGMGTNAINMVKKYIVDNNLQKKDRFYKKY